MTTLVSLVLNNADRLPIVGSPIGQATTWYRRRSNSSSNNDVVMCETPPPPYEKEPIHSRLTQISDYVWKRASFSSNSGSSSSNHHIDDEAIVNNILPMELDKKQIAEGISLIQMATDMNHESTGKRHQMSMDLYMMGLDKILASIPIDSDPTTKLALENKLADFKKRNNLILKNDDEDNIKKKLSEKEQSEALGGLSNLIIQAAVLSAVALKKSSIPGIMSRLIQVTKEGLLKLDEACSIRERTMNITSAGLSKALELDQHYEVHQFFAEVFYTGCSAILKASIAYAEHDNNSREVSTSTSGSA